MEVTKLQNGLTPENIQTLVQAGVIPQGTPPAQIEIFARVCAEKGVSPFSKEIYLVGYGGVFSIIVGINGLRKLAAETGQLAGVDDAIFDLQNGQGLTAAQLKAANKLPTTATVTVWRIVSGVRCPFTHTAVFSEFSSGKQKWQSMPFQMIAKVAESFALRKGFADKTTGLNVEGEEAAIEGQTLETISVQVKKPDTSTEAEINAASDALANVTDLAELRPLWMSNKEKWEKIPHVVELFTIVKNGLVAEQMKIASEGLESINSMEGWTRYWNANPQWHNIRPIADLFSDKKKQLARP